MLQYIYLSPEYQSLSNNSDDYIIDDLRTNILRKYAYLALDQKYKLPTDTIMNELLASEGRIHYSSPEIVPSRINIDNPLLDSQYLKELIHINPAFKNLMDALNLEEDSDEPPF